MNLRPLKIAAPLIAGLAVLSVTAPASARCFYDSYGYRVCHRPPPPPVYYAPPPVYYAPPPYYAPAPRVVVAPYGRRHYHGGYHGRRYYGGPSVSFGLAF